MFDYQSPVTAVIGEMQLEVENEMIRAVQKTGITVDRAELVKALNNDRHQYTKGYNDAKSEIVYCYECKHYITDTFGQKLCSRAFSHFPMGEKDYCSYGERFGVRVDK